MTSPQSAGRLRVPNDLSRTPTGIEGVLVVGSCLAEGIPPRSKVCSPRAIATMTSSTTPRNSLLRLPARSTRTTSRWSRSRSVAFCQSRL